MSTTGCAGIPFKRSRIMDDVVPRQQVNSITSYLDASMVYGSDKARADYLRTKTSGLMKTSMDGKLLPKNDGGLPNEPSGDPNLFLGGDVRANEQAGLTAMHTLFVREHNRLAKLIKAKYPEAEDEDIYQLARKLVACTIQKITYAEFLPALLGPLAPNPDDYSHVPSTDARVANEFSTFAYRFGHSMLSPDIALGDANGHIIGTEQLRNIFFRPDYVTPEKVDQLVIGFSTKVAEEVDARVIEDIRSFLFHTHTSNAQTSCMDLAALNIQRGRDHGIHTCKTLWNEIMNRDLCTFDQLTPDSDVQAALRLAYPKPDDSATCDNVDEVDAWVCGLAEKHVPGASVGELNGKIIKDQFERIMKADPYFYKWDKYVNEKKDALKDIWDMDTVTLAKVIQENTNSNINPGKNVFFVGGGHAGGDPHFKSFGGEYFGTFIAYECCFV